MSFIDFLDKIQRKPRYVRVRLLWTAVFVSMFFVISIWLVWFDLSLPDAADEGSLKKISSSDKTIEEEGPSLKDVLKASLGVFFEKDLEDKLEKNRQSETELEIKRESREIEPAKLPLSD
jgi:hypothetical protein